MATAANDFEALVKHVCNVTHKPLKEIRRDLRITQNNAQLTIERVFAGQFLEPLASSESEDLVPPTKGNSELPPPADKAKKRKAPIVVLDLSDDDLVPIAALPAKKKSKTEPSLPAKKSMAIDLLSPAPPAPRPITCISESLSKGMASIFEDGLDTLALPPKKGKLGPKKSTTIDLLSPAPPAPRPITPTSESLSKGMTSIFEDELDTLALPLKKNKVSTVIDILSPEPIPTLPSPQPIVHNSTPLFEEGLFDDELDILAPPPKKYKPLDKVPNKATGSIVDMAFDTLSSPVVAIKLKNNNIKGKQKKMTTNFGLGDKEIEILDLSQEDSNNDVHPAAGDSMIDDMSRFIGDITPIAPSKGAFNLLLTDDEDDVEEVTKTVKSILYDLDTDDDIVREVTENKRKDKGKGKQPIERTASTLSANTMALLARLRTKSQELDSDEENNEEGEGAASKRKTTKSTSQESDDDTAPAPAPSKRSKLSEEDKVRRAKEKAKKEAKKEAEKEARKKTKEAAAAQKAKDAEIASLNKLKRSKKDTTPEMIVDVSTALSHIQLGAQLGGFLKNWGCAVNAPWQPSLGIEKDWKVVKWRRKVRAEYNAVQGMFLPLPSGEEEVRDEKHVLVHLTAKEFIALAFPEDGGMDLDTHARKLKRLVPSATIAADEKGITVIYMIEGLAAYIRKTKTSANRAFRQRVLSAIDPPSSSQPSRAQATPNSPINEDALEDALLSLQVLHSCLIHQTSCTTESAEWISILTSDISTIPYKTARTVLDTAFCTEVGQVKTGADPQDTFAKMLQEIHRVTPAVANGVIERYKNVCELVESFRVEGNELLKELPIMSTRTGAPSERTVGAALSRRIAGVLLGVDPWEVEQ